ncbi:Oidioi.mRNA.OKI2018_I69.chr2.g7238.t1.cds [Oikopleura dioica]|uniref:Oidioi.mRNA.OKI2018_I69.chr2.g7238.t1.cds n=1 Tax=Oikopleura dioica TaxID=34765 RepID=A0ABN7TAB6_OIKDI|nr:Oidioi.mRNA.OKI2018_I69.chr2.g7238.t1.cds [Oikopleura dioica]
MTKEKTSEDEDIGKIYELASSLAVLVFEVPPSVPLSGIELYKQFVSTNLGTLISQRLVENEDKIRYFGTIETPPSLLITGTRPSLYRLAEAWRNRLLKAPEHTKILTYGMLEGLRMESIPQKTRIELPELVLMAVADLNHQSFPAHAATIQQHLTEKCDEMIIPSTASIEYCLTNLLKAKKIYSHSGGFRIVVQKPTQETSKGRRSCPPPDSLNKSFEVHEAKTPSKQQKNRRKTEGAKPSSPINSPKEKNQNSGNFFSSGFKKLRRTMRKKKSIETSPAQIKSMNLTKQNSDSGVELNKNSNPSGTSLTSSQVQTKSDESTNYPVLSPSRAFDLGYENRAERHSVRRANYASECESIASSRVSSRVKQKPKYRNGRRRRSKGAHGSKSSRSTSRPTSEEVRPASAVPSSYGPPSEAPPPSRGDSTVLLDAEVDRFMEIPPLQAASINTIDEQDVDGISNGARANMNANNNDSITINVKDESGNSISEELRFDKEKSDFPPPPVQLLRLESRNQSYAARPQSRAASRGPSTPRYATKTLPREIKILETSPNSPKSIIPGQEPSKLLPKPRSSSVGNGLDVAPRSFSPPVRRKDLKPDNSSSSYSNHNRMYRSQTPNPISMITDQLKRNQMRRSQTPTFALLSNSRAQSVDFDDEEYQKYTKAVRKQPELIRNQSTPSDLSPQKPSQKSSTPKAPDRKSLSHSSKSTSHLEPALSPIPRSMTPAPRSSSYLNKSAPTPRSSSVVPSRMMTGHDLSPSTRMTPQKQGSSYNLELLEQLSLTREEWVEYFRTKRLPPHAELELEKLTSQNAQRVSKPLFTNRSTPFVTKL